MTDQSLARLDASARTVQLPELGGTVAGVDGEGRIWVVGPEYDEIAAWDGAAWTVYGAEAGWVPVTDVWYRHVRWGQCDPAGRLWLVTSQDVRAFDGSVWTVFTPQDMGIGEFPSDPGASELHMTILDSTGDLWIGECDASPTGPFGGQGARWFDGVIWHGADSPVSQGCVAAIEEDSVGNVWLGADDVLWRYEPASGAWTNFAPPEETPFGYRRHGAIVSLAADPFGRIWVTEWLCGGGSCDTHALYHVRDGVWTLVPREEKEYYILELRAVTDATGTGWLFANVVYRLTETDFSPAVHLLPRSISVDASGKIWFIVHDFPHGILYVVDVQAGE